MIENTHQTTTSTIDSFILTTRSIDK